MDKSDQTGRGVSSEIVGLIPAAGKASRLSPIPCSKELIPIGLWKMADNCLRPKAVSHYLLDKYRTAGVSKVYFILRKGKWDIPAYYGDGSIMEMDFAYLLMNLPYGVPYTLDQAYPFVRGAKVMLGFPDILFGPDDAFAVADQMLISRGADIVIGLFPVKDKHQVMKCDMVQWDKGTDKVEKIVVKPQQSTLEYSWIFAIWTPVFTKFMHDYLQIEKKEREVRGYGKEIYLGHVVQQAINAGFHVVGQTFPGHGFIDIGTPNELEEAYRTYHNMEGN
jgi:glucose-1-phosphate thymidylyltransferase